MNTLIELCPHGGWKNFPRNIEVGNAISSKLSPLIDSGEVSYMNFVSESSMFESEYGQVHIAFSTLEKEDDEIELVEYLSIAFKANETSNAFKDLADYLKLEFGLIEIDS